MLAMMRGDLSLAPRCLGLACVVFSLARILPLSGWAGVDFTLARTHRKCWVSSALRNFEERSRSEVDTECLVNHSRA